MAFVGTGGAKLLLFGEHAVVHGHPALGIGIPGSVKIGWEPGGAELAACAPLDYAPKVEAAFKEAHAELLALGYALPPASGSLKAEGDIVPGSGFGSSGALCAALARCVAAASVGPTPVPIADLWKAAHRAERLFHGRPSGVDTGLALLGGRRLIVPGSIFPPSARELPPLGAFVVFGAVPRNSSCAANVAAIGRAMARGDEAVGRAIAELGAIAAEAGALFSDGRGAAALGDLAGRASALLIALGLGTAELEGMLGAGRAAGALGGKLSGGGGGGAFWLACGARAEAERVRDALRAEAARLKLPGDGYLGIEAV